MRFHLFNFFMILLSVLCIIYLFVCIWIYDSKNYGIDYYASAKSHNTSFSDSKCITHGASTFLHLSPYESYYYYFAPSKNYDLIITSQGKSNFSCKFYSLSGKSIFLSSKKTSAGTLYFSSKKVLDRIYLKIHSTTPKNISVSIKFQSNIKKINKTKKTILKSTPTPIVTKKPIELKKKKKTKLTVNPHFINLKINQSKSITYSSNKKISHFISDNELIQFKNNTITGIRKGICVIYFTEKISNTTSSVVVHISE